MGAGSFKIMTRQGRLERSVDAHRGACIALRWSFDGGCARCQRPHDGRCSKCACSRAGQHIGPCTCRRWMFRRMNRFACLPACVCAFPMHACVHACVHARVHAYKHAGRHTHIAMHPNIRVHTYIFMPACARVEWAGVGRCQQAA
eukprot:365188-Chlamydomonas_euryale.AAC.10